MNQSSTMASSAPPNPITSREKEILHLVAFEYSTKQIAGLLSLSIETVNSHRKNMMRKLHVKNSAGLVRAAFQYNIINLNAYPEMVSF